MHLFKTYLLTLVLACISEACSQNQLKRNFGTNVLQGESTASDSETASGERSSTQIDTGEETSEDPDDQLADEPVSIGGTFLTCLTLMHAPNTSDTDVVVGCHIRDSGEKVMLGKDYDYNLAATAMDSSSPMKVESLAMYENKYPWHWKFRLKNEELGLTQDPFINTAITHKMTKETLKHSAVVTGGEYRVKKNGLSRTLESYLSKVDTTKEAWIPPSQVLFMIPAAFEASKGLTGDTQLSIQFANVFGTTFTCDYIGGAHSPFLRRAMQTVIESTIWYFDKCSGSQVPGSVEKVSRISVTLKPGTTTANKPDVAFIVRELEAR